MFALACLLRIDSVCQFARRHFNSCGLNPVEKHLYEVKGTFQRNQDNQCVDEAHL